MKRERKRSTLPKSEARRRYITIGEHVALEQIQQDAKLLAEKTIAVGPFARLDANLVAARDGKTRGALTNVFGSQAAFQAATMALALNASDWVDQVEFPALDDFATADEWFDGLLIGQSARGPSHGAPPAVDDGGLWALWLSAVPYGLWSEEVSRPSLDEYVRWVARLETIIKQALDHFRLALRSDTTANDLACALAGMIEGVWLNQCLSTRHPTDPSEPVSTVLRRSGRLLWRGAIQPLSTAKRASAPKR
jgi:hypothetical protein